MPREAPLSRRERQIMDVVFSLQEATVNDVVRDLPDPPTATAVRRLMHILVDKGQLKRKQRGREVVYQPRQNRSAAGRGAMARVVETFFGGSLEQALAAHLHSRKERLDPEELKRIAELIVQAQKEGR